MGFRYQYSDRHFVGHNEQEERKELGNQVKNTIYTADFGLTYGLSERTSLSVSLPFTIAERSQAIGAFPGERNETSARGMGDLIITARRWMLDPSQNPTQNVQLGFGLKFPTGQPNATDTFKFQNDEGEPDREQRTVDQSIQPGDGGFGFLVDVSAFKQFGSFAPYFNATYLFNPEETNGVDTYRGGFGEEIMSIADNYLGRAGLQWAPAGSEHFTVGLGGRIEGVPVNDLLGGSQGFRRPGYAISIEPNITYARGRSVYSLALPYALTRNRQRSVPDQETPGRHGDAAFADWVLLLGWSYRL